MYFIVMCAALALPLWLFFVLYCCYAGSKKEEERNWAILTCYGFIAIGILITAWICYYFCNLYPYPEVYEGIGDKEDKTNYRKTNKTFYLVE